MIRLRRCLRFCSEPRKFFSSSSSSGGGNGSGSGIISTSTGVLGRVWGAYTLSLEKRPLLTKSITCGVLSFSADVVSQRLFPQTPPAAPSAERKTDSLTAASLDWYRLLKFTTLGIFYVSPTLHLWYGLLARTFPGAHMAATMQRLALDQLLFAPAFIAGFFSLALLLEGRPEMVYDKLRSDWLPTFSANLTLWVPSMFINFRYIPPQYQVLFSNCVGFYWNIYLSFATYKEVTLPETSGSNLPE